MSTDQPEGVEPSRPGRAPRVGDSRSPVGSTLSIILAVVAVVAGFLILRTLNDDDDGGAAEPPVGGTEESNPGPNSVDPDEGGATSTSSGLTTTVPPVRSGATIAVANASGEGGTAGTMSTALVSAGYQGVGDPGNKLASAEVIEESIVYYAEGDAQAQAVARTLARDLGVGAPQALPDPRPVDGNGDTSSATVLVLLGSAQAGEPLAGASATAPTVAGGGSTTTSAAP